MEFLVINGPNLDLLGAREPGVYGKSPLADLEGMINAWAESMAVSVECRQSASESEIISWLHRFQGDGVVINPGAFTHTSRAISDAIAGITAPVMEVHISNVKQREPWRANSVVSEAAAGTIYGRGLNGYRDAIRHLVNRSAVPFQTVRYGPHPDNVADLRRGDGRGLVVLVHGGLWRQEYERDTTESLAVDLTRRGFDTLNVEYRRLGDGGGWPGSAHDVLTCMDTLPRLGYETAGVVSHSAGSHLAMWAVSRSRVATELHVALAPIFDLQSTVDNEDPGAAEAASLLDAGAPREVAPNGVPTIVSHGDGDQIVPMVRSVRFAATHEIELHRSDTDHFALLDPSKQEWEWVTERLRT
jgi:3-dehydroquinate dehydratase-2